MLFVLVLIQLILVLVAGENYPGNKPYVVVPLPLDFPNRNDRADQCWLRVEDVEIVETITVSCHIAQAFLHNFIQEYNAQKMIEDKAAVTPWNEEPSRGFEPFFKDKKIENGITAWQMVTILDPTTNHRLYVTKNADCKLIMYSREGMTSYKVECDKILYFININSGVTSLGCARVLNGSIIVILLLINIITYF